jgi:3-methylcrotonyl-CoA carboxylase alpha subunit
MEAMKMEHTIRAPKEGTIEAVFFSEGEMVDGGTELLSFTSEEEQQ